MDRLRPFSVYPPPLNPLFKKPGAVRVKVYIYKGIAYSLVGWKWPELRDFLAWLRESHPEEWFCLNLRSYFTENRYETRLCGVVLATFGCTSGMAPVTDF